MIGQEISHYRVLERLGGGGMGEVFKAEDVRLGRTVALKFLPSELGLDPVAKERFTQEARAASALDHPNICTVYDVDETDDGRLFIAMAFYDGQTLKKHLRSGPLSIDRALGIAEQVAKGLVKAHGEGIVHRDVKPANVMITEDGGGQDCRLRPRQAGRGTRLDPDRRIGGHTGLHVAGAGQERGDGPPH